jgi:hypothetical protein
MRAQSNGLNKSRVSSKSDMLDWREVQKWVRKTRLLNYEKASLCIRWSDSNRGRLHRDAGRREREYCIQNSPHCTVDVCLVITGCVNGCIEWEAKLVYESYFRDSWCVLERRWVAGKDECVQRSTNRRLSPTIRVTLFLILLNTIVSSSNDGDTLAKANTECCFLTFSFFFRQLAIHLTSIIPSIDQWPAIRSKQRHHPPNSCHKTVVELLVELL